MSSKAFAQPRVTKSARSPSPDCFLIVCQVNEIVVARLRYTYIFELPRELYNSNIFSSFHSKSARIPDHLRLKSKQENISLSNDSVLPDSELKINLH
jgi:hypothetical protein